MPNNKKPSNPKAGFMSLPVWAKVLVAAFAIGIVAIIVSVKVSAVNTPVDGVFDSGITTEEVVDEQVALPEDFSGLLTVIETGELESVTIDSSRSLLEGTLTDGRIFVVGYPASGEADLIAKFSAADVGMQFLAPTIAGKGFFYTWIFPGPLGQLFSGNEGTSFNQDSGGIPVVMILLIIAGIIVALMFVLRRAGKIGFGTYTVFGILPIIYPTKPEKGAAFSGGSRIKDIGDLNTNNSITLDSVAGNGAAKESIQELLDILVNPLLYRAMGVSIPSGILFNGPPGTGKTLTATALKNETGYPMLIVSGSAFMNKFVGTGPDAIRKLYERAEKLAEKSGLCFIFIDEFDSVGRARGGVDDNGEQRRTISELLTQLDGAKDRKQPIVTIAATNRKDDLDPAMTRTGRFNETVDFLLPTKRERNDILVVHLANKIVTEDIDTMEIAGLTERFSGADLENLTNRAAITAGGRAKSKKIIRLIKKINEDETLKDDDARVKKVVEALRGAGEIITQDDLRNAISIVIAGRERKFDRKPEDTEKTAKHELAHAVVANALSDVGNAFEIDILPRASGSGGHVLFGDLDDTYAMYQDAVMGELAAGMAGLVIEKLLFDGKPSSGPGGDLRICTQRAREITFNYGWDDEIGPVVILSDQVLSDNMKARAERSIAKRLRRAERIAHVVVTANMDVIERAYPIIVKKQRIRDRDEIADLLDGITTMSVAKIEQQLDAEDAAEAEASRQTEPVTA